MLKNIVILNLLFCVNFLFSQNKSREEVIILIAEDTCDCIKSDPDTFSASTDMSKKEVEMGLCLIKSFNERKKLSKSLKKEKVDFEALGEEVGVEMISICGSEFMAIFSGKELDEITDDNGSDDNSVPPPPSQKNEDDLQLEAKLVILNNDVLSNIIVEDSFGKRHTFLIVEQFEGDNILSSSNLEKQIRVYYKEANYYDLSEKRYLKKKVIKYIEII